MRQSIYRKEHLNEISFPLGGIGTGSIGLAGNASLADWEIFNSANKNSLQQYAHFAIKAERDGKTLDARVLSGDSTKNYSGRPGLNYGNGMSNWTLAGFPHFRDCEFRGEYPLARVRLREPAFPGEVRLTAFNPFIPLNADDSGIPAAFFSWHVKNTSPFPVEYTVGASLRNPQERSVNTAVSESGLSAILLDSPDNAQEDPAYREMALATDATEGVALQEYWFRGMWYDGIETYWRNFTAPGLPGSRHYDAPGNGDMASLYVRKTVLPSKTAAFRFVIAWNCPWFINTWDPCRVKGDDGVERDAVMRNYYSYRFSRSLDSARYALAAWDRLFASTRKFHDLLWGSTLPAPVIDAAAASISVLKTPTCLRVGEKGDFYGWEGLQERGGSCEGSCAHVWNYVYATCFLFPELERSLRETEYRYNQVDTGEVMFRTALPFGRPPLTNRACVDGQMGGVIKVYREWKISGDDDWLRVLWPSVKRSLEYAWSPRNHDLWDADHDGVMEGRQHHTLDTELFGPSSWLQGFYLGALRAASEMARHLGEDASADEYDALFASGKAWTEANLFNGEYYFHKIDLTDRETLLRYCVGNPSIFGGDSMQEYWNEETGEINYQIGDGCEIDQMVAQWHADILGLGDLYDPAHVDTALNSLFRYNFRESMRGEYNPYRVFCVNDEAGTIMCSFPANRRRPAIPILTSRETMHGFEYAFAGLLFSRGHLEQGLRVVRAVRDRYDGKKRNPWNEMECGSNYARSMSSFSFLPILSGMRFDMTRGLLGFAPRVKASPFRCFWALNTAWGCVELGPDTANLSIAEGKLTLAGFSCPGLGEAAEVFADGKPVDASREGGALRFASPVTITKALRIPLERGALTAARAARWA